MSNHTCIKTTQYQYNSSFYCYINSKKIIVLVKNNFSKNTLIYRNRSKKFLKRVNQLSQRNRISINKIDRHNYV